MSSALTPSALVVLSDWVYLVLSYPSGERGAASESSSRSRLCAVMPGRSSYLARGELFKEGAREGPAPLPY